MQTRLSLQELAQKVQESADAKKDFVVPSNQIYMTPDTMVQFGNVEPLRPTGIFHEQMSEKLSIPKKYYDRMLAEDPALLANNVNSWLQKSQDNRMVRTLGPNARALLSDRFRPLDNDMILRGILPVLGDASHEYGLQIVSAEVTDRRMYLQAVFPRIQGEVKVGDVVQAGVIIGNSEVGLGRVFAKRFLYRLVCLNGMTRETELARHHVGRQIGNDGTAGYLMYESDTIEADNRAFQLMLRDTVKSLVSPDKFQEHLQLMQDAAAAKIETSSIQKTIKEVTNKFSLAQGEADDVLKNLIEGGDLSKWGLANAVTAMANTAEDYDRAVDLQGIGGKIIDLSPGEWRSIAAA